MQKLASAARAISRRKLKAARNLAASVCASVPGEVRLPARVGSGTLRRAWCFWTGNVRHQADIHAAVLGASISRVVLGCVFVLAQADQINLVGRNALGREILHHGISA